MRKIHNVKRREAHLVKKIKSGSEKITNDKTKTEYLYTLVYTYFYEVLKTINGNDPEEKESMKQWAKGLGWTGRISKPENML